MGTIVYLHIYLPIHFHGWDPPQVARFGRVDDLKQGALHPGARPFGGKFAPLPAMATNFLGLSSSRFKEIQAWDSWGFLNVGLSEIYTLIEKYMANRPDVLVLKKPFTNLPFLERLAMYFNHKGVYNTSIGGNFGKNNVTSQIPGPGHWWFFVSLDHLITSPKIYRAEK